MNGWFIPPPGQPLKSDEDLRGERQAKIGELGRRGLLRWTNYLEHQRANSTSTRNATRLARVTLRRHRLRVSVLLLLAEIKHC